MSFFPFFTLLQPTSPVVLSKLTLQLLHTFFFHIYEKEKHTVEFKLSPKGNSFSNRKRCNFFSFFFFNFFILRVVGNACQCIYLSELIFDEQKLYNPAIYVKVILSRIVKNNTIYSTNSIGNNVKFNL